jgi:hypothetical protein
MKNLNFKKWMRIGALVGLMTGVVTLHFNCAPSMFQPTSFSQSSTGGGSLGCEPNCFEKPASPYTLMTSHQVFSTMLNVTGQTGAVSGTMRQEYDARTGSLADNDNLASVNAPLQMATTSLAGEVCNSLLTREQGLAANARQFFSQVDFNRNLAGNTTAAYTLAIENMARSFWGRALTADETQVLNQFYNEFSTEFSAGLSAADQVRLTRKLYLSACSAMLSSFDAMIN